MSASSPHKASTPKSSSPPDLETAVQELLELRKEKQRYRELQALLRQGLDGLRRQQEAAEQAEFKFRQALKHIIDISIDVDNVFGSMLDHFNRMTRYFGQPYFVAMKKRQRLDYISRKYEDWLGISIQHHEEAIKILQKTLDALQNETTEEN